MTPELKKRVITAMLGVGALLLVLVFLGDFGAVLVASVLSLATLYEFTDIVYSLPDKKDKRFMLLGSAYLMLMVNYWKIGEFALLIFFFLAIMAYFLFTSTRHQEEALKTHYQEMMYSIFGFIYLGFLPSFLVSLRMVPYGLHWVMLFLLICWANDTGAYFAGLRFGRRKLFAHISPKKSWEGALGGALASMAIAILYKALLFRQLSWAGAFVVPVVISIVSPVGDLAESFLKRSFDKKDSSTLLPGHGGFLDRFDGVVFSLPVMYALTRIFGAV